MAVVEELLLPRCQRMSAAEQMAEFMRRKRRDDIRRTKIAVVRPDNRAITVVLAAPVQIVVTLIRMKGGTRPNPVALRSAAAEVVCEGIGEYQNDIRRVLLAKC